MLTSVIGLVPRISLCLWFVFFANNIYARKCIQNTQNYKLNLSKGNFT